MANKPLNPTAAAVAGAVIGAAVGATAVALSDEKNRKVVVKKLDEVKTQGQKTLNGFKKKVDELRNQAGKTIEEQKNQARTKLAGDKDEKAQQAAA